MRLGKSFLGTWTHVVPKVSGSSVLPENWEDQYDLSAEGGEECEVGQEAGEGDQDLVGLAKDVCFSLF